MLIFYKSYMKKVKSKWPNCLTKKKEARMDFLIHYT